MLLYLVKVEVVIELGFIMLNWIFLSFDVYMDSVYEVLKDLELLIDWVNDLVKFRIEVVL